MNNLPNVLEISLFNYLNLKNKFNLGISGRNIYYNIILLYIKSAKIIQNTYRNNLPRLPNPYPLNNKSTYIFNINYKYQYSKKLLIRHYIAHYPLKYLLLYPEFLLNKCTYKSDRLFLLDWIKNKTPNSIKLRTIRHVRDFLMLNEIKKVDIEYAGW